MNEYLNENVCQFDNDASASSFGWNFQTNAGIFLFLKYMPEVTDIKIESKSQDIEMILEHNGKVFAQAKSSQDYTAIKDQKEKFKDAIISLVSPSRKNGHENTRKNGMNLSFSVECSFMLPEAPGGLPQTALGTASPVRNAVGRCCRRPPDRRIH